MIEWWRLWQTRCNRVKKKHLQGGRQDASVSLEQGSCVFLVVCAVLNEPMGTV